jgi:predicted negative regulator of RcsB-dependent stress response
VLNLPKWCRVPTPFVGRDAVVQQALGALEQGNITLVGPPGAGATTAGGAVLFAASELGIVAEIIAVRVDGCTNVSDLIRELGISLGLLMPGDPSTVRTRLRDGSRVGILIDDGDLSSEATKQILAITGPSLVIVTGRESVLGATIYVDPVHDSLMSPILRPGCLPREVRGLPLLAVLPPPTDPVDPWSTIQNLPEGSELLADVPMGLDDEGLESPAELSPYLLPVHGRLVFRRAVRETLGASQRPSAETLREVVRDRLPELHRIAADVDPFLSHADIVLLRTAAEQIQEPDLRALAGAAASRMMIRMFQAADALALTQVLLALHLPPTAKGLLRWVQGDAHIALGSEVEAQAAWRDAARALKAANRTDVAGALARAVASRLIARGNLDLLDPWMAAVQAVREGNADRSARADALRISGDIALASGDATSAQRAYTAAQTSLRGIQPRFSIDAIIGLSSAMAAIDSGELDGVDDRIQQIQSEVSGHPLLRAVCETLRGEIALRLGNADLALECAERAGERWRWTGSIHGLCVSYRILGDAKALQGRRDQAITQWRESIRLGVQTFNLPVVQAALNRIAAVERDEGIPGPHRDEAIKQAEVAKGIRPQSSA